MIKLDLVNNISTETRKTKKEVSMILEEFMSVVKESLGKGGKVYLKDFGSFAVKIRGEKIGRDIRNNTSVKIPACNIPFFKPAKKFKKNVKEKVPVKV